MSGRAGERIEAVIPGELWLGEGTARDYEALARFHYLAGRPATWARVGAVRYFEDGPAREDGRGRTVAVGVMSWPTLASRLREAALGISGWDARRKIAHVNRQVRTISRVIVHPQFRGLGLAVRMIEWLIKQCNTRYIEAFAAMGRVHPMFEKAGMRRAAEGYYLLEKEGRVLSSEC